MGSILFGALDAQVAFCIALICFILTVSVFIFATIRLFQYDDLLTAVGA